MDNKNHAYINMRKNGKPGPKQDLGAAGQRALIRRQQNSGRAVAWLIKN